MQSSRRYLKFKFSSQSIIIDSGQIQVQRKTCSISRNRSSSEYWILMDTCSLDNINSVEEQASFPFKIIILIGIMMIVAICILLKKHFKTYSHVHIMTSIEECAKVRGALVISSEFPSPPVQQKSTDKGELVY